MNRKLTFLTALTFSFLSYSQDADDTYKLLFIGVDGVRSDALQQQITNGNAPNIKSIFDAGMSTYDSWNMGTTSSGPSWSNMLTGVWQAKHGVSNNNYTGSNYNTFPYFPTRVKECRPDLKAVQITSWAPMSDNVYNDGWNNKIIVPTDDAATQVAINQLQDPQLDLLFFYLNDCDAAGHGNGFNPTVAPYMNAIAYADSQIGQVLTALQARPNYSTEKWLILVCTDHGGSGTSHGGNSNDERHIWWGASGYQIPHLVITGSDPGSFTFGTPPNPAVIQQTPVQTDIAVTALNYLIRDTLCIQSHASTWNLDGKSWLIKEESTAGLGQNKALSNWKISPNPTTGICEISIPNATEESTQITLCQLDGTVAYSTTIASNSSNQQIQLDLSNLTSGTYLIRLTTKGQTSSQLMIKQ
ncbi:alkaline phosphatase family protein [Fluviicola sp.]|uniref:alkaline phosphatase family protein n=1 Tax=Fluviicola sp. TaxID=1917219 RepID=UPI00260EED99|nr:alkaline phosphatase family protein [Fluviicola sp.]